MDVDEDLRASSRVSASVLASRVLGLVREVVFATLFGAGAAADAFAVAFRIPNVLRDLLAEGALSSAFVPTFTATLHNEGDQAARRLANLVLGGVTVLTGGLTLLGVIFAEPIVELFSAGFDGDPQKVALAARLTAVMMPLLTFVSLGAVWMGVLNAQRRFVIPALAPAVFNVVSLVAGLVVWQLGADLETSVLVWAIGTLVGGGVQAGMQMVAAWRLGFRPGLALRGLVAHPGIRRIGRLMAPAVLGVAAIQINVLVNTRFSGSLGDGAVAQLGYAFRLFFLPLGVFGVALATVTMTSVSEAAAKGDRSLLAQRASDSATAGWMLTGASAVGLAVLAHPVVSLIFEHGNTGAEEAIAIAACLQAYVVGLVPYSLVKIFAPSFYAVDRPRVPLLASALGVAVNITFNALTFRQLGAPGIALGTALGAMVNVSVLRIAYGRLIAPLPSAGRARRFGALLIGLVVLGGVAWLGRWGLQRAVEAAWLSRTPTLAIGLSLVVGLAFVVYASVLAALRYPGARLLLAFPRKILGRITGRRANRPADPE